MEDWFAYGENKWPTVRATLPAGANETAIRADLENAATFYLASKQFGQKSQSTVAAKASSKRIAMAAQAFLDALVTDGPDPIHSGLGQRVLEGKTIVDADVADREFDEMRKRVSTIAERARSVAEDVYGYVDLKAKKGEKADRRNLVERFMQIREHHEKKPARIADLLDFLDAATRPVLVGGDFLGEGMSGRDALRQSVKLIRAKGYRRRYFFATKEISPHTR